MADCSEDCSLLSPRTNTATQLNVSFVNFDSYVLGLSLRSSLKSFLNCLTHIFLSDGFGFHVNLVRDALHASESTNCSFNVLTLTQ